MDAKFISDSISKLQVIVQGLKVDIWYFAIGDSNSCHRKFPIRESSALGYVSNRDVVLTFANEKSIILSMLYMKKNEKSKVIILRKKI